MTHLNQLSLKIVHKNDDDEEYSFYVPVAIEDFPHLMGADIETIRSAIESDPTPLLEKYLQFNIVVYPSKQTYVPMVTIIPTEATRERVEQYEETEFALMEYYLLNHGDEVRNKVLNGDVDELIQIVKEYMLSDYFFILED